MRVESSQQKAGTGLPIGAEEGRNQCPGGSCPVSCREADPTSVHSGSSTVLPWSQPSKTKTPHNPGLAKALSWPQSTAWGAPGATAVTSNSPHQSRRQRGELWPVVKIKP